MPKAYPVQIRAAYALLISEMTVNEFFLLRKQGRIEEAYDAIRMLYANDKGAETSLAMFWTATDILKKRLNEKKIVEAKKIYLAIERMLPHVPDEKGWVKKSFEHSKILLGKEDTRCEAIDKVPVHMQTGLWGEEIASACLREKGYIILERNWHSNHRDIDIIAKKDDEIVFVEVKTRRNRDFTDPIQAVNYKKRNNLRLAINHYIKYRKYDGKWHFDIISVIGTIGCAHPEIEHLEDIPLF